MNTKPEHTQIVLSGVEGDRHWNTAINQGRATHLLMSFLYSEKKGSEWVLNRLKKHPTIKLILDSGAHSFRSKGYCDLWPDVAWFDSYAERYRDFISRIADKIDFVVNLDVDTPCGLANMIRWDNDIFRPLERSGIPVCYVWHESYGIDGWVKMCREHSFVGLPGHLDIPVYHRMMKAAMANGCRVHGFAATKAGILGKVPFSSADSISWKSGEMYGQTFVFENGALRVYDKGQKDVRAKYKARWVELGVDWGLLEQDEASEITKVCAIAWADYQDHVSTMTKKLAYWNKTSAVVDELISRSGGVGAVLKENFNEVMATHKVPLVAGSDAQAREDLREMRAFLARDDSVIFTLSEERIDYWIKAVKAEPENSSRVEREAAIRQALYQSLYKIQVEEAKGRDTAASVEPIQDRWPTLRVDPLTDFRGVAVELPDPQEESAQDEPELLTPLVLETTPELQVPVQNNVPRLPFQAEAQVVPEVVTESQKSGINKKFVEQIPDDFLRVRAGYGVELVFHQHKLKYEAAKLKALRREPKKQKTLLQKAASLAVQISEISQEVGPDTAAKMAEAGHLAYDDWLTRDADKHDANTKKVLDTKALSLNPQAKLFVENPAVASAVGRLGGAPKGNQNARKHGIYSSKMPQMACDNCPHIQVCPQYRAGHVCAYLNELTQQPIDAKADKEAHISRLKDVLQSETIRLRRAMMFETFEGGIINKEVSKLAKSVKDLTQLIYNMENPPQVHIPFGMGGQAAPAASDKPRSSFIMDLFKDSTGAYAPGSNPEKAQVPDDASQTPEKPA